MGDLFSRFLEPYRRDAESKNDSSVKCELPDTEEVGSKSDSVKCELSDTDSEREQVESESDSAAVGSDTEQVESKRDSAVESELSGTEQVESKRDSAVDSELSDTELVESKRDSAVESELSDTEQVGSKRDSVKSKGDSAECRAFRKCFSVLADGIADPGWLAVQLYSSELVGADILTEAQKQAVAERTKIVMLLSAVKGQIMASPATKF